MSDQGTPNVVQLLVEVMRTVRAVGKDGLHQTQHARFNFRGIDAVMNAVGPALRDVGVVVIPRVIRADHTTVSVGRNNTQMGHVKVEVEYTFYGPAGDTLVGSAVGEAMDSGDKATAKAMSVAFRTYLLQALCLPTCEPDPDEEAYERSPVERTRPAAPIHDEYSTPAPRQDPAPVRQASDQGQGGQQEQTISSDEWVSRAVACTDPSGAARAVRYASERGYSGMDVADFLDPLHATVLDIDTSAAVPLGGLLSAVLEHLQRTRGQSVAAAAHAGAVR